MVRYEKEAGLDSVGYHFFDINGDGISELITGSATSEIYDIYTISNGEIKHLAAGGERDTFKITSANEIVEYASGGAAYSVCTFYKIENGMLIPLRQSKYDDGTIYYSDTFNGLDFINLKIVDLMEAYETKDFMFTSFDNYKPSGAVQIVVPATTAPPANNYTTYDISAATSDFHFYSDGPYSGYINTANDPLNLRAKPDANSEVIIKMPRGSKCSVYGSNSMSGPGSAGWCYIGFTQNGVTYYGYASNEFIGDGGI